MSESHQDAVRALSVHSDARRRDPRIPFITAVELETPYSVVYGFSDNVSLGGMLVRTDSALAPGSPALITFILRGFGRMQIQARIVHCRPGVRAGIQFVGLTQAQRAMLRGFAQPEITAQRRSPRIPVRLFLEISWNDKGQLQQASAETVMISRHGCLVLSKATVEAGSNITLLWPDVGTAARARVVSRQESVGELPRIALEFTDTVDFWATYFPAA